MKRRVEVVIDELVLHGFNPADRDAIGQALSAELARLISGASANVSCGDREDVNAGTLTMSPALRPNSVGERVGRAVFACLISDTQGGTKPESRSRGNQEGQL